MKKEFSYNGTRFTILQEEEQGELVTYTDGTYLYKVNISTQDGVKVPGHSIDQLYKLCSGFASSQQKFNTDSVLREAIHQATRNGDLIGRVFYSDNHSIIFYVFQTDGPHDIESFYVSENGDRGCHSWPANDLREGDRFKEKTVKDFIVTARKCISSRIPEGHKIKDMILMEKITGV